VADVQIPREAVAFPEHDKLSAIADKSQTLGEFIEWLPSRGIHLGVPTESGRYLHFHTPNIQALLAAFFEIDQDRLETEKRQMLNQLRKRASE
jgi:hypothetical protein